MQKKIRLLPYILLLLTLASFLFYIETIVSIKQLKLPSHHKIQIFKKIGFQKFIKLLLYIISQIFVIKMNASFHLINICKILMNRLIENRQKKI